MSSIARSALLLASALLSGAVRSQWPPDNLKDDLGLQHPADGGLEIRVWLGGGITYPEDLYRVSESNGIVSVEHFAWVETTRPVEGYTTQKEARRETNQKRNFMKKYHCGGELNESANALWCRLPVKNSDQWPVVLKDLLPEELW